MTSAPITEGKVLLSVPAAGKPCETWYKVVGDLKGGKRPLVVIHGGPGATHDLLIPLSALASPDTYHIPVIFYDQLGNGRSTHLKEKNGDVHFWTEELFLMELDALLTHLGISGEYDVLGHSWGGMLAARHASRQPAGLRRLVIASAPASMDLWIKAQAKLLAEGMTEETQKTIKKHEEKGTTDSPEYQKAMEVFYAKHLCVVTPPPQVLEETFDWIKKDPTVYLTMNGPSEFHVTGPLKNWTVSPEVDRIAASTLLTNGRYDEAQDSTMAPFFQRISRVKWVTFEKSSHVPHLEETERYIEVVGEFLSSQ